MKIFSILIFAALVALTGCKPKQITLSGQIFIVTQGAENVKLGDVEVFLIEKSQMADFLQKKQSLIESEIASWKQEFAVANTEVEKIQNARTNLINSTYETNADYVKIKEKLANLQVQIDALYQKNDKVGNDSNITSDALQEQMKVIKDEVLSKIKQVGQLQAQLNDSEVDFAAKKDALLAEQNDKLEVARLRLTTVNLRLNNFPTAESYFADFVPVAIQKTFSDADGKFSLIYPRNKPFTIFASAQRMVLNKTEKYYWLVNAPTNGESVQIFLSNNNLAEVDPDGYFPLKLKQVSDESVAP